MKTIHNTITDLLRVDVGTRIDEIESSAPHPDSIARLALNLQSLNLRFLLLVAESGVFPCAGSVEATISIADSLRKCSAMQLAAIARCPVALFDLDFDNEPRWSRLFTAGFESYAGAGGGADLQRTALVQSIVFFAWHAVQINSMFVRFALGLRESTVRMLASVSIGDAMEFAERLGNWLSARWIGNSCFWPDLLRFASADTKLPFEASKLQACQLLAAARVLVPWDGRKLNRHEIR